jgi:lipopolysaccharide export system protein LptA
MNKTSEKMRLTLLIAGALACATPSMAQITDSRLPISLDADSTDYDGKNSMMMFRGLRLSQGTIGVEADQGMASKLDFDDSVWQFSGNVRIDTGAAKIRCNRADLRFVNHKLQIATISGAPAKFELRRQGSDEVTYAEAGRLEYNFATGTVEFSEQATITEGGNRISSNYLVYNIAQQRINAESSGSNGEKVKIIYTPAVNEDEDEDSGANEAPPAAREESPPEDTGVDTGSNAP